MKLFYLCIFLFISFGLYSDEWLDKVSNRVDEDSIKWVKEQLKKDQCIREAKKQSIKIASQQSEKKCKSQANNMPEDNRHLYVCMSFSIPDRVWVSLSKELDKVGGIFVLQGLPSNSFVKLSERIKKLNELGVNTPIQIHPKLFILNHVQSVPTFLIVEKDATDKISGNINLSFALQKMAESGETLQAKEMHNTLKAIL